MRFHTCLKFLALFVSLASPLSVVHNASADPLPKLSAEEIKTIKPFLKNWTTFTLSTSKPDGSPNGMLLISRIKAPREVVFDIFRHPENFYYMSTLFKENKVLQQHNQSMAWSWASRHKLFSFTGTNSVNLFPPRRADVAIQDSTLGSGKFRINFYKDGPKHTIIVISGILEVESSEWLIRYLIGGNPAMKQAMNVAIGQVIVKGTKAMAERAAKEQPMAKHRIKGKRSGPLKSLTDKDFAKLDSLLKRGSIILTRSVAGGRLDQSTVVDYVDASMIKVREAVSAPKLYPKMIKAISEVKLHEKDAQGSQFSWKIGLSAFALNARLKLSYSPDGVLMEGLEGDLMGALWRWQIKERDGNKSIVAYHGWANIDATANILKMSVKREPYLEHGFMSGSNMVMLRSIKNFVEK